MSKTVIKVDNLSKQYRLGLVGTGTLSHDFNRWWHLVRGKEDPYLKIGETNDRASRGNSEYVWALRDINFEVKEGEVLGIIGKNGAGKSTLLKLLSKVTAPTTGSIKAKGRIASLLEVGTGFHPELTGRENIYLNGTILGMTKAEVSKKLDEIVAFAGVERYLDTPVKRYSSGMTVRLGFAVAAHLEPEILIVDEVLAVGDIDFQNKAIGKMQEVSRKGGRTVLFVSHNMASIQNLCTKTTILEKGIISFNGETISAIKKYLTNESQKSTLDLLQRTDRRGNHKLLFRKVAFETESRKPINILFSGQKFTIKLFYESKQVLENVIFRIIFCDQEGNIRFICNNYHSSSPFAKIPPNHYVTCTIPKFPLPPGKYFLHLQALVNKDIADEVEFATDIDVEEGDFFKTGKLPVINKGVLVDHYWEKIK